MKRKLKNDKQHTGTNLVHLCVGGTMYYTSASTLCCAPTGTLLQRIGKHASSQYEYTDEAISDTWHQIPCEQGCEKSAYWIDWNGRRFEWILDYLRGANAEWSSETVDEGVLREMLVDARYFNLWSAVSLIEQEMEQKNKKKAIEWAHSLVKRTTMQTPFTKSPVVMYCNGKSYKFSCFRQLISAETLNMKMDFSKQFKIVTIGHESIFGILQDGISVYEECYHWEAGQSCLKNHVLGSRDIPVIDDNCAERKFICREVGRKLTGDERFNWIFSHNQGHAANLMSTTSYNNRDLPVLILVSESRLTAIMLVLDVPEPSTTTTIIDITHTFKEIYSGKYQPTVKFIVLINLFQNV